MKHDHFNSKRIRNAKIQEHVRCILGGQAKMQRTLFVATYAKFARTVFVANFARTQEHKNSVRATLGASMSMADVLSSSLCARTPRHLN